MVDDYKEEVDGEQKLTATIPEAFQEKVHELLEEAENQEQCDYICSCVRKKETEMRKSESQNMKGKNPKTMGEFSTADMPQN